MPASQQRPELDFNLESFAMCHSSLPLFVFKLFHAIISKESLLNKLP